MRYQFDLDNQSGEEQEEEEDMDDEDEEGKDDTQEYDLEETEEEKPYIQKVTRDQGFSNKTDDRKTYGKA